MPSVLYQSSDPDAPVLTGTNGDLVGVLKACLVNGYGTAPNDKPALGWEEVYTGTDKSAFRSTHAVAAGAFLQVLDNQAEPRIAEVRGFEAMSDVDTGTEAFPTAAQQTHFAWVKSHEANNEAREWWLWGDERLFYIAIAMRAPTPLQYVIYAFGDVINVDPASTSHCMIAATLGTNYGNSTPVNLTGLNVVSTVLGASTTIYWMRPNSASPPGAIGGTIITVAIGTTRVGGGNMAYPDPVAGGVVTAPVWGGTAVGGKPYLIGRLPGLYVHFHEVDADSLPSSIPDRPEVGKTLQRMRVSGSGSGTAANKGVYLLEGEWR